MQSIICIQAPDGKPLMPTKRFRKIRIMLKEHKAVIVDYVPFTVQLLEEPSGRNTQRVIDGTDPGRTNIGACDIRENGDVLYSDRTETRNKEVPRGMKKRAQARHASRRGERQARKRLAKANGTIMKSGQIRRHLPGYGIGKTVPVKDIINTEARFMNRVRSEGWLTPTARHLVATHLQGLENRMKRLPVTDAVIELNKFAFMAMENPDIQRWQYQQGPLHGKGSVKDAVYEMQNGHCLLCGEPIDQYHHHDPQHLGGSDTLGNMVGLCEHHHTRVHNEMSWEAKLDQAHTRLAKKYGALSVLNQAIPFILKDFIALLGAGHVFVTDGYTTHQVREALSLPKDHDWDAYIIAASVLLDHQEKETLNIPKTLDTCQLRQFRRHSRAIIKSQTERTYKLDGVVVAKNRRKRMDQKDDSLHEWYMKTKLKNGKTEAQKIQTSLIVSKSKRRYNQSDRVMPGAVFIYEGTRYVLQGQLTNGQYYRAVGQKNKNFPAVKCVIVQSNTGLVAI